ncbi:MAG: hypothetical protein LBV32_08640 [Tannerellaceae bacterium]|jgi:hypothetical protein|nr:hypothetical protein [Tannerellaceae bacterium]
METISSTELRKNFLPKREFIPELEISDEVPEDFHRAITVEEAKSRVQKRLREMFKMKREQKAELQQ